MVRAERQSCWLNRMEQVLADSEFESFEFAERLQGNAKLIECSILANWPLYRANKTYSIVQQEDKIVGHLNNWNWNFSLLR